MDLISFENVMKIKTILLNNCFNNKYLNLNFKDINTNLKITNVSENESVSDADDSVKKLYFLNEEREDNVYCLKVDDKEYKLFLEIGRGSAKSRIDNMRVLLGTNYKLGDSFAQLELSQALEDNKYIYITKNISKLAGEGAISRINSGLKNDKNKKIERRDLLVKKLKSKVITFDNNNWMCISKIKKSDIENPYLYDNIFFQIVNDFIKYAFTIEEIVAVH